MLLTQELLMFGLSNKEAEVYLASLQLGYASVQEIADKAGINRTTAYAHIKSLISRGLINVVEKNDKLFYVAEKPEKLKFLHEQQEKEVKRRKEVLKDIMPQLESLYNLAQNQPTMKYYDFIKESNDKMREEILAARVSEMYNIFNYELFHPYTSRRHIQKLLGIVERFKLIYVSKNKTFDAKIYSFFKDQKFKIKYLPEEKFAFLCEILIVGERVYICKQDDAVSVRDPLFAQTLTLLFHALWGIAEEV